MKRLEWILLFGLCLLVLPLQGGIKLLHKFAIDHGAGCVPYGDLILSGSTLYGMTYYGGYNDNGTIFKMQANGSSYALLHEFAGGADDGAKPSGSLILSGSTLFGMTESGGIINTGVIFRIETDGSGYTILHKFANGSDDGSGPKGSLLISGSTIYGMTQWGGDSNCGVIFKIQTDGSGFALLHEFADGADDGARPDGSLILSGSILYGMTYSGGDDGYGTIFKIQSDGSGFTLLHEFANNANDGHHPYGSLLLSGSTLYGMTSNGGSSNRGTIFKIESDGSSFALLHSFVHGANDGGIPFGSLIISGSTLYGMTAQGGDKDYGTIFKIGTNGGGFVLLHKFAGGGNDGARPYYGSLRISGYTLYGMTSEGGDRDQGTAFKIQNNGTGFVLLREFAGSAGPGSNPSGDLVVSGTTLYGMTDYGGANNHGAIFKVQTDGSGYALLHSFAGYPNDGAWPQGSLLISGSTLYGMTHVGGANDLGTIFKIQNDGSGYALLHKFSGHYSHDGANPYGSLIISGTTLYGMTADGGTTEDGTIFRIQTNGTGFTLLHEFNHDTGDGFLPEGSLIISGSTLYGMTALDGNSFNGTIFKIKTDGSGYAVLHQFAGYPTDGSGPDGSLVISGTTLYGMTSGVGKIFMIQTDGSGYALLHDFAGGIDDGDRPYGSLLISGSTLYGMTYFGGESVNPGQGTVFEIKTDGSGFSLLHKFAGGPGDGKNPRGSPVLSGSTLYGMTYNGGDRDAGVIFFLPLRSISGSVTCGGSPLANVVMNGLPGAPCTNNSGFYTALIESGWSGTVTPTHPYYAFSPSSTSYTNVTASQTTDYATTLNQSLVVTAPSNATVWEAASAQTVTWLKQGIQNAYVRIKLYKGTSTWVATLAAKTANNGSFDWFVPKTLAAGGKYFIRVQTIDNLVRDDSDKFSIIVPAITVTAPTTGTIWARGTTKAVTWNKTGTQDANVKMQLYRGTTKVLDITASTPNSGSFDWAIPGTLANALYTVRITTLDGKVKGSSKSFTVANGMIRVTAPAAGALWQRGVAHAITWSGEGLLNANVRIQLLKGDQVSAIATTTPNDGSFDWFIPADKALANYKIRVTTVDNQVTAKSGIFTITNSAGLILLAPNGDEVFKPLETQAIRWSVDPDVLEVKLEFSRDNGSTFSCIADRVANTGRYEWQVPVNFTRNGIVRVSDADGRPWRDDGLLEFSFNFIYGGEGDEAGALLWFGGSDSRSPSYGFAKIALARDAVQFSGFTRSMEPLNGSWHELRVRFDFHHDTGTLYLDEQPLLENIPLFTSDGHYFEPNLALQAGGDAPLDFEMDNLAINVVQLDGSGKGRQVFNVLADDFERYDEKSNVLQNCWQFRNVDDKKNKVELDMENGSGKALRLRTAAGKRLVVHLPIALPERIPFDISDKNLVIDNR